MRSGGVKYLSRSKYISFFFFRTQATTIIAIINFIRRWSKWKTKKKETAYCERIMHVFEYWRD